MDSSLRSTARYVSPLKKAPALGRSRLWASASLPDSSLTTKQPMKIGREIAEVLQSGSNRCAAKWKELGAPESTGKKTRLKQRRYTFCTRRRRSNGCSGVNQQWVGLLRRPALQLHQSLVTPL